MLIDSHHEVVKLNQWFFNFRLPQNHLEGWLVKTQIWGPYPRVSDSVDLKRGLGFCVSNKFPGEADTTNLEATFLEPMN